MIRNTDYKLKDGRGRREVTNWFIRYNDVQNNTSSLLDMTCSLIYQYQYFEETQGVSSHTTIACMVTVMKTQNLTGLDGLEILQNALDWIAVNAVEAHNKCLHKYTSRASLLTQTVWCDVVSVPVIVCLSA